MDKETLSNYGWIVICVMVLAVMLALASPFGNFVADAIKSTTQGLFDTNQKALQSANINIMQQEFENMLSDKDPALNPTGVTEIDDSYSYGDYTYTRRTNGNPFGASTLEEAWEIVHAELATQGMTWQEFVEMNAQRGYTEEQIMAEMGLTEETFVPCVTAEYWSVSLNLEVTDKNQTSYGPILESINGMPVTTIQDTFRDCVNLTAEGIPTIPDTITTMRATFAGCNSLTDLSDFVIPDSVTDLNYCFAGCDYLISAPELPKYVVDIGYTFLDCDALINPPSTIPSTVVNMEETFFFCKSLENAPAIPSGVTNMRSTFFGCISLVGTIEINATNLTNYSSCFASTSKPITLTGTCPKLIELASTGNKGNVTVG